MQNNADKPKNPFEEEREIVEMVAAIRAKVAEIERERLAARRRAGRQQKRKLKEQR